MDLFASEFDFKRQSVKEKFLPKHKDYNLDKAYETYAFLKSYEKHKQKQKEYELILRRQPTRSDGTMNNELEEEHFIFQSCERNTSSDDDDVS